MNSNKVYWFEQPYLPGALNIAVSPAIDPRDGRLCFSVPGDSGPFAGIWGLVGEVTKDGDDYFEFTCDDSVMHMRGGTYKFTALNIKTFRKETYKWIAEGETIAEVCQDTNDLYFWYRKNWPNTRLHEIGEWEMKENQRKGIRTDYWNKDNWEREAQREREKREIIGNRINPLLWSGEAVWCKCLRGTLRPVPDGKEKPRYFVCGHCGMKWDTKENVYIKP